ncbi:putative thiol methyltransferase 2 [Drosera capensis]
MNNLPGSDRHTTMVDDARWDPSPNHTRAPPTTPWLRHSSPRSLHRRRRWLRGEVAAGAALTRHQIPLTRIATTKHGVTQRLRSVPRQAISGKQANESTSLECRRRSDQWIVRLRAMAEIYAACGGRAVYGDVVELTPEVEKMRGLVSRHPLGGWKMCWEEAVTPWDLGQPTPILLHLLQTGSIPTGRTLVPGCGSGYDVIALAGPDRYVIGLDISDIALSRARQLASKSLMGNYCTFLKEDFFDWKPTELFDLIFDYTYIHSFLCLFEYVQRNAKDYSFEWYCRFFVAIDPKMRPAWARRMSELLKPDGELITLMFPIDDHVGGPPHKTSVAEYEAVLCPLGFQAVLIEDNDLAFGRRKGKEKLGRWRRTSAKPSAQGTSQKSLYHQCAVNVPHEEIKWRSQKVTSYGEHFLALLPPRVMSLFLVGLVTTLLLHSCFCVIP